MYKIKFVKTILTVLFLLGINESCLSDESIKSWLSSKYSSNKIKCVGSIKGTEYGVICSIKGGVLRRTYCAVYQRINGEFLEVLNFSLNTPRVVVAQEGLNLIFKKEQGGVILAKFNLSYILDKPEVVAKEIKSLRESEKK